MTKFYINIFKNPYLLLTPKNYFYVIFLVSSLVLVTAYGLEIIGNLPPCELCIYQRIPYVIQILLSLFFFRVIKHKIIVYMSLISLFSNLAISTFHSLIERDVINFELGCTSTNQGFENIEDLRSYLEEIPIAKCDEITFELLNLSIANFNLIISFLLILFTSYILINYEKKI